MFRLFRTKSNSYYNYYCSQTRDRLQRSLHFISYYYIQSMGVRILSNSDIYCINIDYLPSNAKLEIGNILNVVYIGSNFIFQVLYSVLLVTPPSILIIPWLLHALTQRDPYQKLSIRFNRYWSARVYFISTRF